MTGNSSSILGVADNRGVSRQRTRAVSLITSFAGRIFFATSPLSIPETTRRPVNRERKIAEHRSFVACQDLNLAPATVCARQSHYDNRASQK